MSLAPLLAAPPLVQIHVAAALGALLLGTVHLLAPKGTLPHRRLGWVWVGLMVVVALTSFGITSASRNHQYSTIHLISGWVLLLLPLALVAARRHSVARHGRLMLGLFLGGPIIAGSMTLLPGRLMGAVVFGW